jgi:hypothetical protein
MPIGEALHSRPNMKKPMQQKKTKFISYVIAGLVVYLLLFSVFALYHVYAANEWEDSHGCAIGEWVHLGQQAAVSLLLLSSVYLLLYLPNKHATIFFTRTLLWRNHLKRGPPPLLFSV